MKHWLFAATLLIAATAAHAQVGNTITLSAAGAPAGPCGGVIMYYVNVSNGDFYDCPAGTFVKVTGGGGSGTVTVVSSGSLTSTALVTGGGTTTLQTPAVTATMDASGNISTPGSITSGAGGSVAGGFGFGQGTAPSLLANGLTLYAPTSITTGFGWSLPAAENAAAGILHFGAASSHISAITISPIVAADITNNTITGTQLASSLALVTPNIGVASGTSLAATGALSGATYATATNCAAAGSAANPSLVACAAAASGSFSCATNASTTTCVVSTTAVTANSRIFVQPSSAEGANLSVTCNTTSDTGLVAPRLAAKSAGTSFTINLGTFTTNPECFNYWVVN